MFFRRRKPVDPLSQILGWLSKDNPVRVRDLLRSIAVFGATGSGKTSGVARWLAALILSCRRVGMLILCAKPEDKEQWLRYYGKRPLKVFEPGGSLRFNVLDYIIREGGDYRDVTRCLMAINETLVSGGQPKQEFWEHQLERKIYNGVVPLKLATGGVSAPNLQRFFAGAATKRDDLAKPEWKEGDHNKILRAAYQARKTPEEEADFAIALDYFLNEWPGMNNETRSSIGAMANGLLHAMCTGQARTLISGETNFTPRNMLEHGESLLVNAPVATFGSTGKIVNTALKWTTQWSVLRRAFNVNDYINVIFVDEAQQFVTEGDSEYLAQCRSHGGCMVYLTQARPSYYAAMGGERMKHKVDSLLGNFNTKIFCALGDVETAQWASQLVGRGEKMRFSGSSSPSTDGIWDTMMGQSKSNTSYSMQMDYIVEPNVFMHRMRTGGPENKYLVDGVVIKTAEPFANGANWLWSTFPQR